MEAPKINIWSMRRRVPTSSCFSSLIAHFRFRPRFLAVQEQIRTKMTVEWWIHFKWRNRLGQQRETCSLRVRAHTSLVLREFGCSPSSPIACRPPSPINYRGTYNLSSMSPNRNPGQVWTLFTHTYLLTRVL